ncbi:unnamed protein product [Darwinula stevensoni]|uniref:Uncharacterized protein n=1 Tax=Darwinula stevensoni TaxID=69355 RepID=A0A7R9AEG6_9CRUS|nr:unnamed protein product [Darwinula stevensoni]CAG0901557.1 unnamed protein product [Darwinula stevensoni]
MKEVGASVRGWVLVFYHEDFDVNLDLPRRDGVENDVENLRRVFRDRGFLVKAYKDLKFEIIKRVLNETARSQDLKDHDCLIVCLLSHGQDGGHLFANNVRFDEEELWRPFYEINAKLSLINQSYSSFRGEVLDEGVKTMVRIAGHSRGDTHDGHQRHEEEYHLPTHGNILIAHATYEGHVAWKSSHLGSYFIYTLCEVFEKHSGTLDLIKILTIVAQIIAFEFKSSNTDAVWDNKKQMPTIRSTLTRELYLTPKAKH